MVFFMRGGLEEWTEEHKGSEERVDHETREKEATSSRFDFDIHTDFFGSKATGPEEKEGFIEAYGDHPGDKEGEEEPQCRQIVPCCVPGHPA